MGWQRYESHYIDVSYACYTNLERDGVWAIHVFYAEYTVHDIPDTGVWLSGAGNDAVKYDRRN